MSTNNDAEFTFGDASYITEMPPQISFTMPKEEYRVVRPAMTLLGGDAQFILDLFVAWDFTVDIALNDKMKKLVEQYPDYFKKVDE